ncbi:MAG TPA: WecB/TagA/CpsF family glycosyltransferase [Euzebyales bacterium]|nr:WecB/TagA/CpsF family glycosyltransferase [Euzebyales bacterium]
MAEDLTGPSTATTSAPPKTSVVGIPLSLTSYDDVLAVLARRPDDRPTTVAVCNVHSVMTARREPDLRRAISEATIATTDGVPLVWVLRLTGNADQTRVYGPDLMELALADGDRHGWRHFLFGTTPPTLERLTGQIARRWPRAQVVGAMAPPFRPLTPDEEDAFVAAVRGSGADIVWVGLGMPRQELFIHRIAPRLPGVALLGVGAAFDFLSGTVPQAPAWLQRAGLEWLYRLLQEPRRLWRRYVVNNPLFVLLAAAQVVRHRRRTGA